MIKINILFRNYLCDDPIQKYIIYCQTFALMPFAGWTAINGWFINFIFFNICIEEKLLNRYKK